MPDRSQELPTKALKFGTSGIRGVVGEDLTRENCEHAGSALGTLLAHGARVCLGRDTRQSGPAVSGWVVQGLCASGVHVTDFGVIPTPVLAALTRGGDFSLGVMLTASHNPPQYNGIKVFDSDGVGLSRDRELQVEDLLACQAFATGSGSVVSDSSALERYLEALPLELVRGAVEARIPVLLDPGNGAASGFARKLFEELGLQVSTVNDVPDGSFPGRGSEPSAATLGGTVQALQAQGGLLAACFDGDADRVLFCDTSGFLGLDEMVAFVANHCVRKTSRSVLATTVETGLLPSYALEPEGGTVVRGKVGDVAVAHLARETNAALGAETIGVYIFPDQGLYPDSLSAVLHVLGMLRDGPGVRDFVSALPRLHLVKRKVSCANALKSTVMSRAAEVLGNTLDLPASVTVNTTDGLRLEMPDCWVLVRPSGTEPVVRVTTEATSLCLADSLALEADGILTRLIAETARAAGTGGDA